MDNRGLPTFCYLAELQTKLVVQLGEYEALESVCSFQRLLCSRIDRRVFSHRYPDEASECSDLHRANAAKVRLHEPFVPLSQPVIASANGMTPAAPARRKARAASVIVQPVSTQSSTSRTAAVVPRQASANPPGH